jgi:hypothetical protein
MCGAPTTLPENHNSLSDLKIGDGALLKSDKKRQSSQRSAVGEDSLYRRIERTWLVAGQNLHSQIAKHTRCASLAESISA